MAKEMLKRWGNLDSKTKTADVVGIASICSNSSFCARCRHCPFSSKWLFSLLVVLATLKSERLRMIGVSVISWVEPVLVHLWGFFSFLRILWKIWPGLSWMATLARVRTIKTAEEFRLMLIENGRNRTSNTPGSCLGCFTSLAKGTNLFVINIRSCPSDWKIWIHPINRNSLAI